MKIPVSYFQEYVLGQPADEDSVSSVFIDGQEALFIEVDGQMMREYHSARLAWRTVQNKIAELYYEAEEAAYEAARTKPIELNATTAEMHEKLNQELPIEPESIQDPLDTEISA